MKLYNDDAESAVIGAICMDGSCLLEVIDMLTPESFYIGQYREVFNAAVELDGQNVEVDIISLGDYLDKRTQNINWFSSLADMAKNCPSTRNIKTYAANVQEYFELRNLLSAGQGVIDICGNPDLTLDNKLSAAQDEILSLDKGSSKNGPVIAKEALKEWVDHIVMCGEMGGGLTGDSCGFPLIDERTKGFHAGELIVIAARPAMGKTNMALNIIASYLHRQQNVLMFSLEMSKVELYSRLFPIMTGTSYSSTLEAKFNEEETNKFNNFIASMADQKFFVDDDAAVSISAIRSHARKINKRKKLDLIVVDYMGLVEAEGYSPTEQVSNVSKGLKRLAKTMGCPVIALSQLSRKCDERPDSRPILSDLRQSGSIEQDADIVAFLYRDEVYYPDSPDKGIAEFIIRKLRHGEIGTIPLATDFGTCRFLHTLQEARGFQEKKKQDRGMSF
jgi:replicative DNA helicase